MRIEIQKIQGHKHLVYNRSHADRNNKAPSLELFLHSGRNIYVIKGLSLAYLFIYSVRHLKVINGVPMPYFYASRKSP